MAEYMVVFNGAPRAPNDPNLETAPIASTKILSQVYTGDYVYVEAADVEHAQKAVERAYKPSTGTPLKPIAGTEFSGKALATIATAAWKES